MKKNLIIISSLILCFLTAIFFTTKTANALTVNNDGTVTGSNFIEWNYFFQDVMDDTSTITKTITINNQNLTAYSMFSENNGINGLQTTYLARLDGIYYIYADFEDYIIDDTFIYFNLYDTSLYDIKDYFYSNFDDTLAFNSPEYALNMYLVDTNIDVVSSNVELIYMDTTFVMSGTPNATAFSSLWYNNNTFVSSFISYWYGNYDYDFISWNPQFEIQTDTNFDSNYHDFYFLFSINSGGNPIPTSYDKTTINDKWFDTVNLENAYNVGYNTAKENLDDLRELNNELSQENTRLEREYQQLEQDYDDYGQREYSRGFQNGLSETTDLSSMDAIFEFFKNLMRGFKGVLDVRLFGYFSLGNILSFFVILLLFKWVIDLWR